MEKFFNLPHIYNFVLKFLCCLPLITGFESLKAQPLKLKRVSEIYNPDSVVLGRICPDFHGKTLEGVDIPISTFRGSFVFIMVWATSTHSSQIEYPYFKRLRARNTRANIQYIDVAVDKDKKDWEFYFNQNPEKGFHLYTDPFKAPFSFFLLKRKDRAEHTFFSYTTPLFILLNPEGRIVENKIPYFPSDSLRFNRLVSDLP